MKKFLCVFLAMFTLTLTGCGGGKEVYSGDGWKISYDLNKWKVTFEAKDGTVSFGHIKLDETSFAVTYCPYYNRGVVDESGISMNERLEKSRESCERNGWLWSGEIIEIDSIEWGRVEFQYEDLMSAVYFHYDDSAPFYACNLSFVAEPDVYYKGLKDFEEIFDSFEFTE